MTRAVKQVLKKALELTRAERLELAHELLDHLEKEGVRGEEIDRELLAEIDRRLEDPEENDRDGDVVMRKLLRRAEEIERRRKS